MLENATIYSKSTDSHLNDHYNSASPEEEDKESHLMLVEEKKNLQIQIKKNAARKEELSGGKKTNKYLKLNPKEFF